MLEEEGWMSLAPGSGITLLQWVTQQKASPRGGSREGRGTLRRAASRARNIVWVCWCLGKYYMSGCFGKYYMSRCLGRPLSPNFKKSPCIFSHSLHGAKWRFARTSSPSWRLRTQREESQLILIVMMMIMAIVMIVIMLMVMVRISLGGRGSHPCVRYKLQLRLGTIQPWASEHWVFLHVSSKIYIGYNHEQVNCTNGGKEGMRWKVKMKV